MKHICFVTERTTVQLESKTSRGHLMPPQLHVCNGLARPANKSVGMGRIMGHGGNIMPLLQNTSVAEG